AGGEPPPAATGAPELRYDRLLGQRGELPQRAEPELPEPPVRVGIERQHGNGLRGEELPLLPRMDDDRAARLGAGRCYPSHELPLAPPHTEMRSAECGMRSIQCCVRHRRADVKLRTPHSTFRTHFIPHSALDCIDDPLRPSVD